jgi:iron complex transport system substrate-binding protein
MKKTHIFIPGPKTGTFLLMALALVLGACTPSTAPLEATAIPEQTAVIVTEVPAAEFIPVTFTDALGNEVTIDVNPERIISLAPSLTESLFAIGAGSQVVGRTEFCDYPAEALDIPVIGGFSSSTISVETIIDLEPDLVIGGSIYQSDVIDALTTAGIKAITLEPESVQEILDTLTLLGRITGNTDKAELTVTSMQDRLDTVEAIAAQIPEAERVSVFYEVWNDPYMSASNRTFIGELIEVAGGRNIFGDLEEDYPTISTEEVIEQDPQVIIGPSNHADQLSVDVISGREGWSGIAAVKNQRVYIIDGNIASRSGPRIVDALDAIAVVLYPNYFPE